MMVARLLSVHNVRLTSMIMSRAVGVSPQGFTAVVG